MARSPDRATWPTEGLQSVTGPKRRPTVGAVDWSGDRPTTVRLPVGRGSWIVHRGSWVEWLRSFCVIERSLWETPPAKSEGSLDPERAEVTWRSTVGDLALDRYGNRPACLRTRSPCSQSS